MADYLWDSMSQVQRDTLINEQTLVEQDHIERLFSPIDDTFAYEDAVQDQALTQMMDPFADALQMTIDHYLGQGRPRLPEWIEPVCRLGIYRTAYFAVRQLVNLFTDQVFAAKRKDKFAWEEATSQTFSQRVSEDCWEAMAYMAARSMAPEFHREQSKYFRNWDSRRRKAFAKKIDALNKWKFRQKVTFGDAMLEIAKQVNLVELATFTRRDRGRKNDKVTIIRMTEDVAKLIEQLSTDTMAWLCPTRYPMVCRPLDISPDDLGGWRTEDMRKRATNITGAEAAIVDPDAEDDALVRSAPADRHSDASRKTINSLQRTEWRVNRRVLQVMADFWTADTPVGRIPSRSNEKELIGRCTSSDPEEIKAHKRRLSEAHSTWARQESKRLMFQRLHDCAWRYVDRTLWHAYFCDFRGRFYSDSAYLNPQGCDLNKALICYASPYKVSKKGIYWLMVALANEFGYDKDTFDGRVQWVKDRMDLWQAIDADPYGTVTEWEDDAKMKNASFLRIARVFDLMEAIRTGWSSMPVNLDGSCNGVQHWAALTRDLDVAEKVNLIATPSPQDLYQFVADGCQELCESAPNPWRIEFLEHWEGSFPRKVCKRSVMCDPYGITNHSVKTYVRQEGHVDWVPKENRSAATSELGALICEAKEKQMRFINHGKAFVTMLVGWYCGESDSAFWWYSPNGFKAVNFYPVNSKVEVSLHVYDKNFEKRYNVQRTYAVRTDQINANKAAQAMPPNWVHSVDGAHMSLTVNAMIDVGITQLSFIHDSFGCPAEDVPTMRSIIVEKFHEIHVHDQLDALAEGAQATLGRRIPADHPIWQHVQRGDWKPGQILESEYAFG